MYFLKKNLLFLIFAFGVLLLAAQETEPKHPYRLTKLALDARVDFDYWNYSDTTPSKFGFAGKYIDFMIDGHLTEKFTYHYRQRLNIAEASFSSFYRGCDWLYLQYRINPNFSVEAGKQCIYIGGIEYDLAPIDVYFGSNFWENITCYEVGASASYYSKNENHQLTFQVCNSPFVSKPFEGLLAYNLIWYGKMGVFSTIYSVNMIEYAKGKYINYIALGNQFNINGLMFYVDFINRATAKQVFLFSDFTVIGEVKYTIKNRVSIFGKGGYDVNNAQSADINPSAYFDRCVLPGTEFSFAGLGTEFFPIKDSQSVRLHAFFAVQNNKSATTYQANLGLTWNVDFLKIIKKKSLKNKDV